MEFLFDIFSSAGFGTLLGGIFGYFQKREERKNLELKYDHEVNMIQAQTNASVALAKVQMSKAQLEGELAVEKKEAQAFVNSQITNNKFSEILKDLIRPAILGVLMYMSYNILVALEQLTGGVSGLPQEEVMALYKMVVLSVLALTGTATGWYFSARTSKQFDRMLALHAGELNGKSK